MKIWNAALACGVLGLGAVAGAHPAAAQGTQFPDVPANHWAYQAVQDLADKGYVKGYPDGKFLGKRDLTRYEFATVIDRMVQTINDLSAKVAAGTAPTTPTGNYVTQDDLNKLQALVDSFHTQLEAIQSQIGTVPSGVTLQDELDSLRQDVLDNKAAIQKAQSTADNSYGAGANRKFQISGYVQARYQTTDSGSKTRFPRGAFPTSGPYNGTYNQGGNTQTFDVRRSRLKVAGSITDNTKFAIQIDASGAVSAGASPNQQVTVREGYVAYTFGNGNAAKNLTATAGLFATPFGYILPASMATSISPERPLAFSEAGYGIFPTEDYEKGVQFSYNTQQQLLILPAGLKLSYALVNGTGRTSDDTSRRLTNIGRIAYQTPNKMLGLGVSYMDGTIPTGTDTPGGAQTFRDANRRLFGADAQLQFPGGIFANAEYVGGLYERRSLFNGNGLGAPVTEGYIKHNQVKGYYVNGGYTFGMTGSHPLTLAVQYDQLLRSHSADLAGSAGGNGESAATLAAEGQGASYDDANLGYGVLYNLDKATRLRFWYERPTEVAHAANTPQPQRIGLFTTELQVRF